MRFFEIRDRMLSYYPKGDSSLLEKAYVYVATIHRGQVRFSGEPYLDHPLAVAGILTRMHLDEQSIVSGLLHDIIESRRATSEEIEELFGAEVSRIVQGVTKLSQLDFANREERQTEYIRKMILAMSQDVRVVLVKLADRLHEMRSSHCRASETRAALAQETLDIYAPLAARLGIDWIKQELEDLAFRCKDPAACEEIVRRLEKTEDDRRRYIEEVKNILNSKLEEHGIKGQISGRPKHLYSIYQKMIRQNLDLNRIYDLIAFRVIVDSLKTCYEALAVIHAAWEPVGGRFKDYIVKPKSNMYQSLHTTVIGPYQERMEVQIRTEDMNRIANEGIAAHWLYKEGKPLDKIDAQETRRFSWMRELMDWNKQFRDPQAVFEAVKVDFYPDEVYVFTPRGEVKSFPRGATPVDFAYEVHTEVGHRCVGARVNGKLVPLRYELQNGDSIEILTASNHRPSKDWLKQVKSSKAINRIRHWFKEEERERSVSMGKELCEREFRKRGLNFNNFLNSSDLMEAARAFSMRGIDDLLAAVGFRKITAAQVIGKLPSVLQEAELEKELTIPVEKRKSVPADDGIKVKGVDDVMIRMAKCCNPVPGEKIVGYITRGRGITVHRVQCRNVDRGDSERTIDVQWDSGEGQVYPVDVKITHASDRGILAALNSVLGQLDANVVGIRIEPQGNNNLAACSLKLEVKDTKHLQRVLSALRAEKGVYRVQRSME